MDPVLRQIAARLEARKDLAIANVAPKLVGVDDVSEAEQILKEFQAELLDELDDIERELLPPAGVLENADALRHGEFHPARVRGRNANVL